jgi:diamine N-acetyltransferase
MTNAPASFSASHYDVSPGVTLTLLKPFEAGQVGVLFASIDPWARYPYTAAQLTKFFAENEPGAPRFAIRVDGALEGGLIVRTNWFRGPYIHMLALAPGVQGRAIGSAVMDFIEREARRTAERNVWVAASDFNEGALRFYARHGFTRVAAIPGLVRDERTEILLRKQLTGSAQPAIR